MAELTGSEIIARCLQKEGIKDLFYIMGGPMLLAEATCIKEGIRMIDVRHEQAAAFACQAYSRLKQEPSVCMAASGPGVTNIELQQQCPLDGSEHLATPFDHIALRDVLNALDPVHARAPSCGVVAPIIGG